MVRNIHERQLAAPPAAVGTLIDSLATADDRLWPRGQWPAMRFDRPLGVGARGGHGPIRYTVVAYEPGARIRFEFSAPAGFRGHHGYEVLRVTDQRCLLRHSLVMTTRWPAWVSWPMVYRPLHDALIEDSLDTAAHHLGLASAPPHRWTRRVRGLRSLVRRRQP
ncbi:hypothetical protein RM555_19275 [Micromonospora sp. DSM 115977]|uniref:Polyketide cyclase / dehydrase and lipid transport n=1 Tax=Micromonospora reichwaldensis TaxID=3075516 RepID=A0ABU2WYV7_9ACTN|nr:hypothetical protein [Micromonospora sp. DSM 115977]MDT0531133.1 hypothetical protein [Micromonospora sp. DSM 115977]